MFRKLKATIVFLSLMAATPLVAQTNAAINCFLGGIIPTESLHETVVTFQNNSDTDVDILWISYEGEEVYYNTLIPGESYEQPSYYGHPWVIYRAESNVCKGIVIPYAPNVLLMID